MFAAVLPMFYYLVPAVAGVIIWTVSVQVSLKWGFLTFVSAAILSLFLVPEIEGKTYFVFLFGYYPLLREVLSRIKFAPLRFAAKLGVFNVAAVSSFWVVVHVLGVADVLDGMEWAGAYAVYAFWAIGNAAFLMYDFMLPQFFQAFDAWIKPVINKKLK
jgi:hypothetical protein